MRFILHQHTRTHKLLDCNAARVLAIAIALCLGCGGLGSGEEEPAEPPPRAPGAAPHELTGATFYTTKLVRQIRADEYDPFEYWLTPPEHVIFEDAGFVTIVDHGEPLRCTVTSEPDGLAWAATAQCGELTKRFFWEVEGADVMSDILGRTTTFQQHDATPGQLRDQAEARYEDDAWQRLSGEWRSRSKTLRIEREGTAFLNGTPMNVQVFECLHMDLDGRRAACLQVGGSTFAHTGGSLNSGSFDPRPHSNGRGFTEDGKLRLVKH